MQAQSIIFITLSFVEKNTQRKKELEEEEIKGKKLRSQPWTIERESDKRRG